jgi:Ycf66 protein N-terminus
VNFGTPVPLLVGIVFILIAVGLFFLDKFKPGYKRDSDTVYSILFLIVGILCLFQLNQEFLPSFQLMIFAGMLIALTIDNIRRRTPGGAPLYQGGGTSGGGSGGFRPSERPSRSYRAGFEDSPRSEVRAEFDDEPLPMEEPSRVRRIRGGREGSSARDSYQGAYLDQLSEDTREPRRSGSRRSSSAYQDEGQYNEDRSRRRSPLQLEGDVAVPDSGNSSYGYGEEDRPAWVEPVEPSVSGRRRGSRSNSNSSLSSESEVSGSSRSARRRSRTNGDRPLDGDYVDYKPLDNQKPPSSDDDFDNSGNFDDNPNFR